MERWNGKIAVVTGASAGIGRDIAKGLAEKGMVVIGMARRKERVEELAKTVKGRIVALKCDLSIESEILGAFRWIEQNFGGVDVLVNNAGVVNPVTLTCPDTSAWKMVLDVNILALSICTREALKTMRQRGDNGHIIHINSIGGQYHLQYDNIPLGMYNASKHAVTSLTETLRIELRGLKSKIKITGISPGSVQTEITDKVAKIMAGKMDLSTIEVGAILQPEDITEAVIYALGTRPIVQVHEITIQPIGQRHC